MDEDEKRKVDDPKITKQYVQKEQQKEYCGFPTGDL